MQTSKAEVSIRSRYVQSDPTVSKQSQTEWSYVQTFVRSGSGFHAFMFRLSCVHQTFVRSPDFRAFTRPFSPSWPDLCAFTRAFLCLCSDFRAFIKISFEHFTGFFPFMSGGKVCFLDLLLQKRNFMVSRSFLIDWNVAWGMSSVWSVKDDTVWGVRL